MNIKNLTKNMQKYMLPLTLLIILLGTVCGYFTKAGWLSNLILPVVFIMIYPMMVNVSFESLKNIRKSSKPLIAGLFINFIIAPILILALTLIFSVPHVVFISLIILAIAPASSMGLGYVGLSRGNMVSASVIVASAFILSLIVYPTTLSIIGSSSHIALPIGNILNSLVFVLVLPLILGLITREYLIERRNMEFKDVKPCFSFITLTSLYVLIFLIFYLKGFLLLEKLSSLYNIILIATLFYPMNILFVLSLNRFILKLSYEDNQAIVFTTVSKNVALTIGIISVSFGKSGSFMSLIPAVFSLIQILFLMTYLHFSEKIMKWWDS